MPRLTHKRKVVISGAPVARVGPTQNPEEIYAIRTFYRRSHAAADEKVVEWLDKQPRTSVCTTSITILEIRYALEILPAGSD